jgi:hypothetical protein
MCPTKERKLQVNGTDEMSLEKEESLWGLRPHTPGIYRAHANPS